MKLTDEQAGEIGLRIIKEAGLRLGVVFSEEFQKAGRVAFEESMRIALAVPSDDEIRKLLGDIFGRPDCPTNATKRTIEAFLAQRIASYYEPQDRTTQRLQKWFETHGHPEFCLDPKPLEQLASIVIDEYEKRKKA